MKQIKKDKPDAADALKVNERKWSKPLIKAGWTAFPNIIVERQKALGLSPLDVNILLHLATYWWEADNKPHPSKATIAEAVGVQPRSVQRRIAALEAAGFIRREERRIPGQGSKTNKYHFDGLIEAAKPYAEEKILEREARTAAKKAAVARRGKPRLRIVKSDTE